MTIPDEAVEPALRAWFEYEQTAHPASTLGDQMRAALTAAAPLIAAQATADFRAGIEVLRDEWRMHEAANLRAASTQPGNSSGLLLHTAIAGLCKAHADALDALLPERAR